MAQPQELYLQKKAAKKAARRGGSEENARLNITSLMDVVSIIVVYLLKSYSTDPLVITPVANQKIPLSSADAPLQDGTPIYISKRAIVFENKTIAQLGEDGRVEGLEGTLIPPLFDAMEEAAEKAKEMARNKNQEWNGQYIVIGDESLKYTTIVNVMSTAMRAGFIQANFCVIQNR